MNYYIKVPAQSGRLMGEDKAQPARVAKVEVTINVDKIANQLGIKAVRSKGGKATDLGGLVTVRVLSIRPATEG